MEKNKQKFTEAYNEYSDAIFRYCLYKISDREKALDFVQETFVRTWQYIQKGNEVENMKTFLYTTARHIIIDEYRKKKTLSLDYLVSNGEEPYLEIEETLYTSIDSTRVMEHVLELPKSYSSIIIFFLIFLVVLSVSIFLNFKYVEDLNNCQPQEVDLTIKYVGIKLFPTDLCRQLQTILIIIRINILLTVLASTYLGYLLIKPR